MHNSKSLPGRSYYNMQALPDALWLSSRADNILHGDVRSGLPAWMSSASKDEIMDTDMSDPNHGGEWWSNVWASADKDTQQSPEFMMFATAMAAVYGWPNVVENLIALGAPLGTIPRPADGWKYVSMPINDLSVLSCTVAAMRVDNTRAQLHPRQEASLRVLLVAGADPNQLPWKVASQALSGGRLIRVLIDSGLSPLLKKHQDFLSTPLYSLLFGTDIELSVSARAKVLSAFIDNGMSLHPEIGAASLIRRMTESVYGLRLLHVALRHPDRLGLIACMEECYQAFVHRSKRMNSQNQQAFIRFLDAEMLSLRTPIVSGLRYQRRL